MTRLTRMVASVATLVAVTAAPALAAPVFTTHLSGKDAVPARETSATGQATLKISTDQMALEYKVIASNIENVVAVRLHLGPAGSAGPEVAVLYGPVAAGAGRTNGVLTTGTLTASNLVGPMAGQSISDLIAQIRTGQVYVNVSTDDGQGAPDERSGDYSSGEIRGQLR